MLDNLSRLINNYSIYALILYYFIIPSNNFCVGQVLTLQDSISFPVEISNRNINPDLIAIGVDDNIVLLDKNSRQIAIISSDKVHCSGGFGFNKDEFIDPVDLVVSFLSVWVLDRSENKLVEYDYKLNFIRELEIDLNYPELLAIDPLGVQLIYSDENATIMQRKTVEDFNIEFIDMSRYSGCIADIEISQTGIIAVLDSCSQTVMFFNRIGRLITISPINLPNLKQVLISGVDIYAVNKQNKMQNISDDRIILNLGDTPVIDACFNGDRLYCLTNKNILVYRIE